MEYLRIWSRPAREWWGWCWLFKQYTFLSPFELWNFSVHSSFPFMPGRVGFDPRPIITFIMIFWSGHAPRKIPYVRLSSQQFHSTPTGILGTMYVSQGLKGVAV